MKNLKKMNQVDTNRGGWNDTYMKKITMQDILKSMPSNLQSHIKEVITYANDNDTSDTEGKPSTDKVFIPGCKEVGSKGDIIETSKQYKFPVFTDNNSRKKRLSNENGSFSMWWTRSPYESYNKDLFYNVDRNGVCISDSANASHSVCFCFNI